MTENKSETKGEAKTQVEQMKAAIKKLNKEQLQSALFHTLNWHERHYNSVTDGKESVHAAFYTFSGCVISIRDEFKLPKLK